MAVVNTSIPGLSGENPHYIPGFYTTGTVHFCQELQPGLG
uniref:Ciliary microtubule inner protein 2B n=1 Tax=Mus musculus TaxID=10090 RepID=G3UZ27_MOUSE